MSTKVITIKVPLDEKDTNLLADYVLAKLVDELHTVTEQLEWEDLGKVVKCFVAKAMKYIPTLEKAWNDVNSEHEEKVDKLSKSLGMDINELLESLNFMKNKRAKDNKTDLS